MNFPGIGTVVNVAAILVGGLIGHFFGRRIPASMQKLLVTICGVSTLLLSTASAMQEMLVIDEAGIHTQGELMLIVCLALGAILGEIMHLQTHLESFGDWLRTKSGQSGDAGFVDAFITASVTICVGAMAILGAIQDGITGDISILATKSVLDFVVVIVFTGSLGIGSIFSAIPVALLQGSVTLLARGIAPWLTAEALSNLSLVGSAMIFCVGINVVWKKNIRIINLLPGIVLAVIWALAF